MSRNPLALWARDCLAALGLVCLVAAGARPAAAQQPTGGQVSDSAPMALIVAVFPDQAGAGQAMKQMPSDQKAQVHSYAIVSKDANGKVTVKDHKSRKGAQGARANKTINGAVALLGQSPQQSGRDSTSGKKAGMSQADANKVSAVLPPDNSAVLLVVPATETSPMDAALQQANPTQVMDAEVVPVP
jgi:uncharacterized membrane protein